MKGTSSARIFKLALLSAIFLGPLGYLSFEGFENWRDSLCQTIIHREIPSPDGEFLFVVFDRDCGAMTNFNTQISIMPRNSNFSAYRYPPFFVMDGRDEPDIAWRSNRHISIRVHRNSQIVRQDMRSGSIVIDYK